MRRLLGVLERAAVGEVVIPVAPNVWQSIGAAIPAAAARRRIIRQGRLCGCVHWMYGDELEANQVLVVKGRSEKIKLSCGQPGTPALAGPTKTRGFSMSSTKAAVLVALLALGSFTSYASAQGTKGADVIIRLRLAGDSVALPPIRSCLVDKLSQMPDVKVATVPTDGVRFIVDIVAAKNAEENISGSLVVVETFPMEQFRPRIKEGEDADALLKSVRYYTLLRLHELVPARSYEAFCLSIAADIRDKVLSKEYTERND